MHRACYKLLVSVLLKAKQPFVCHSMTLLVSHLLCPQVNFGMAWIWLLSWAKEENLLEPQILERVKSYVLRNLASVGSVEMCFE